MFEASATTPPPAGTLKLPLVTVSLKLVFAPLPALGVVVVVLMHHGWITVPLAGAAEKVIENEPFGPDGMN